MTILGYFPGHIHAFYLEYIYYQRKEDAARGLPPARPAPGVYSDRIQTGDYRQQGYGTVAPAPPVVR